MLRSAFKALSWGRGLKNRKVFLVLRNISE